ncbi:MAG: class I adenylate-forming enzyme family protein, partial [Acetobacteraceae bacterium]
TYAALAVRVERLAAGLQARGIGRGDRIAILAENRAEYVEAMLAAGRIGAILACQNWRLAAPELAHCLRLVAPVLTIVSPRHAGALAALEQSSSGPPLPGPVLTLGAEYEALIAAAPSRPVLPDFDPEDGLLILYTSGTTGLPKGALISQRAELARMAAFRLDLAVAGNDGFCAWAPMFHMASADHLLATLMSGGPVIVVDGMQPDAIAAAAARFPLGWLVLMPGAIEPMIAELAARPIAPHGIRAVGAMADLVPTHQLVAITRLLRAPYLNSFGATETGLPPASAALIPPGEAPASLAKRQSALCELRLLDPDGGEVADGATGEMAIRGPTVFSGYWDAGETNRRDFLGGFFRMGDLFRRNPDGSFDFVDRAKYMIKSGGENIYPAEIERVLLADPRIAEAVVVRARDPRWGEVPRAYIVRRDPALSEADIEALCRAALAGYKRPREVRFVAMEELPRSTTGKIQRHVLERTEDEADLADP